MSNTPIRVFVYGSLLPGLHNHQLIRGASEVSAGTITGVLFSMGAFPALVTNAHLREPVDLQVKGIVYDIDSGILADLDALEGYVQGADYNLYERILVDVTLPSGEKLAAFVYAGSEYILRDIVECRLPQVPNGDWAAWAARYVTPYRDSVLEI